MANILSIDMDIPRQAGFYARAHDADDPEKPKCHITVLHCHPITSAREAVRAAIIQEFRNLEPAES